MKRLVSVLLVTILITMMFSNEVFAQNRHETIVSNKFYYIEHVESGRLLDIDSEHVNDNGTQLQIWDKWVGHQNQVFGLVDTGDGWKIYTYPSRKIIEVRNSAHDDYTEIAQWDNHNNKCGRWNIIYTYECITKKETIGYKNNATVGNELKIIIESHEKNIYQRWNGDNFSTVRYNASDMKGTWEYNFK